MLLEPFPHGDMAKNNAASYFKELATYFLIEFIGVSYLKETSDCMREPMVVLLKVLGERSIQRRSI